MFSVLIIVAVAVLRSTNSHACTRTLLLFIHLICSENTNVGKQISKLDSFSLCVSVSPYAYKIWMLLLTIWNVYLMEYLWATTKSNGQTVLDEIHAVMYCEKEILLYNLLRWEFIFVLPMIEIFDWMAIIHFIWSNLPILWPNANEIFFRSLGKIVSKWFVSIVGRILNGIRILCTNWWNCCLIDKKMRIWHISLVSFLEFR